MKTEEEIREKIRNLQNEIEFNWSGIASIDKANSRIVELIELLKWVLGEN